MNPKKKEGTEGVNQSGKGCYPAWAHPAWVDFWKKLKEKVLYNSINSRPKKGDFGRRAVRNFIPLTVAKAHIKVLTNRKALSGDVPLRDGSRDGVA